MSEWRQAVLGSLTTKIGSGATPRGGESVYQARGVSLIRSQNVLDNSMKVDDIARISDAAADSLRGVTVEAGDVLINITGDSVARCAIVDPAVLPARVNQHVAILRPSPSLNPLFLQKLLVSPDVKSHLLTIATGGGTRNALTKSQLSKLIVSIPPLREQQAIAEVLGALDDKIAANTALAATAESLSIEMAATAPASVALGSLVEVSKRQVHPEALGGQIVDHYSLPAFDAESLPSVELASTIKSGKFLLTGDSVLLSKLNPRFPRVWRASAGSRPALASTEFLVLRPTAISTQLLWSAISSPTFASALDARVAGTSGSHQRVKPADALTVPVRDPRLLPAAEQSVIESSLRAASLAREEARTLAATRDALLPRLMSGKLRVRDAKNAVSAAGHAAHVFGGDQ